jgi:hypothetical protein
VDDSQGECRCARTRKTSFVRSFVYGIVVVIQYVRALFGQKREREGDLGGHEVQGWMESYVTEQTWARPMRVDKMGIVVKLCDIAGTRT